MSATAALPPATRHKLLMALGIVAGVSAVGGAAFTSSMPALLLAVLGLAFGLLSLWSPSLFIAVALVLYAVFQSQWIGLELEYAGFVINAGQLYLMAVTTLLLAAILFAKATRRPVRRPPQFIGIGLILAAELALSMFRLDTTSPGEAAPLLIRYFVGVLLCYCAILFGADARSSRAIRWGVGIGCLWVTVTAFVDYFRPHAAEAISIGAYRAAGSLGGVALTSTVCLTATVFFLACALSTPSRRAKLALYGASLFSSTVLLLNFTRAAMLGFVLTLVIFAMVRERGRRRATAILLACVLLVAWATIGSMVLPRQAIEARMQDLPLVGMPDAPPESIGSGRNLIWSSVARACLDNSLLDWAVGHGVGTVPEVTKRRLGNGFYAHNSYLTMLYDGGLVALVLYVAFGISMLRSIWQRSIALGRPAAHQLAFAFFTAAFFSLDMFGDHPYYMGGRLYMLVWLGLSVSSSTDRPDVPAGNDHVFGTRDPG